MPSPIPSSLTAILAAVNTQLTSVTGLPSTAIRLVGRGQLPHLRGDQDILVRPGNVKWDMGFDVGSGRVAPILRRPLLVTVRTRCNLDLSDEDSSKLTDPSYGHIPLEESVCNALYEFVPQDAKNNLIVQEPMHPIDYPAEETQTGQAADWIETSLAFQITYQLPLNPPNSI